MSTTLEEAHRRVRQLAEKMEGEGFEREHIIDALMGVGLNAHSRISGPEALAAIMHRAAETIETGRKFDGKTN